MHSEFRSEYKIHYITTEQETKQVEKLLAAFFNRMSGSHMFQNDCSHNGTLSEDCAVGAVVHWQLAFPLGIAIPLAVVIIFCSIGTVFGNLLVLVAFCMEKRLQTSNNYFLLSLAIADGAVGLLSVNLWLVLYLGNGVWPFGWNLCMLWILLDYTCCTTSIYHVFVISIDRYWSISFPANYRTKMNPRVAVYMMIPTWTVPLIWWLCLIVGHPFLIGRRVPEGNCWANYWGVGVLTYVSTSITYWVPMVIITLLYLHIYRIAHKLKQNRSRKHAKLSSVRKLMLNKPCDISCNESRRKGSLQNAGDSGIETSDSMERNSGKPTVERLAKATLSDKIMKSTVNGKGTVFRNTVLRLMPEMRLNSQLKENKSNDRKAMRTLTFLLGAFVICWTPWNIAEVVNGIWGKTTLNPHVYQFTWLLTYINSSLNPLCYAFANTLFRDKFVYILTFGTKKPNSRRSYVNRRK